MKRVLKTLNGVQSSLLLWGDPFNKDVDECIICVTGNPGLVDFYSEFGQELHKKLTMPVCVIGQAGHEEILVKTSETLTSDSNSFNLNSQIAHKYDLISNYISKKSKLHLIGHSIGAWQIIELTDRNPELLPRILSINLLFPTIQKMADSPNGKFLNLFLRRIYCLLLILLKLLRLLPYWINSYLIYLYLSWHSLPSHYYERISKVIEPNVMEKVLILAFDEMDTVTNLNKDAIKNIKHLTNVIYSKTDNWAPLAYIDDLKMYEPEICLIEMNVSHAFVLKSSELVAERTATFIIDKRKSNLRS
ncbi:lipid droplet-associated hydrolase isoform X2 [Pieris rapae]|uniref:lipid droplet-associated hydrolase isoform X2 n=1 Tax=Pieris rapae TaxID=64459 RepID=UPI001E27DC0F|nr:lipid droplet-associated hydrolase isoform X2 [Pieris rapae]